jgi:hypothetical protein
MERLRTLNSYQIFKIKNKKLKTYSGRCPFKGLSNDTTLMQIQSGRTVPLNIYETLWFRAHLPTAESKYFEKNYESLGGHKEMSLPWLTNSDLVYEPKPVVVIVTTDVFIVVAF